jgi:nucleoside-diphosphate-sugar epimerase
MARESQCYIPKRSNIYESGMKKVLVSGATGFIGGHCIPFLKERGYEIYALSSKKPSGALDDVHWIQHDLLGSTSIREVISSIKPSHLLHLAWVTAHGKLWEARENLDWLKTSIDILEAFACEGGKRAVVAGTCAEYDWSGMEFSEANSYCRPHSLYGSSKLSMYLVLQALAKKIGFSQAWGRIFYLYGPHETPSRFIPSIIRGLLKKEAVPCTHGSQIRDFLHVQDVASAFAALLDSEVQGAVNIASGSGVSLKEVIEKISACLGGSELVQFGALSVPQNEPACMIADTRRLREAVGWVPSLSLDEGINNAITWWKEQFRDLVFK